jgi:hypothetical protein
MGRYLDIVNEWEQENRKSKSIDGHKVAEIVWETDKAIVFRDENGNVWRRVHSWGMTWPVEVGK